jgi:uncharacterized membrane protein
MYQPEAYGIALSFMILSMLCWGSWANTMKLTPGFAFQLFYWDYVLGIVLGSLVWGFTLGNWGGGDLSFLSNIRQADSGHVLFAIAGGAVFNVANLLLVAAIDIAGLAVAFPIGIGLALVEGVLLNYAISPRGHPGLLFGGMALVVLAIILDALAYRRRESERRSISVRGIWISVACGILMGISGELPLHEEATYRHSPGPHVSILRGKTRLAFLGNRGWIHLVYGNGVELRGLPRTNNRPGGLLCNRPRCDDGLSRLGRFHLERICQRSTGLSQTDSRHVYLLLAGAGIDRNRTHGEIVELESLCRSQLLSSAVLIST